MRDDGASAAIIATYENEHVFRDDEDAWGEYQAYLAEHDAYTIRGGVLYADDFVGWLNWSRIGQQHRDRVHENGSSPSDTAAGQDGDDG